MTDADLEAKVRACCAGVLDDAAQGRVIQTAWSIQDLGDARGLADVIQPKTDLGEKARNA